MLFRVNFEKYINYPFHSFLTFSRPSDVVLLASMPTVWSSCSSCSSFAVVLAIGVLGFTRPPKWCLVIRNIPEFDNVRTVCALDSSFLIPKYVCSPTLACFKSAASKKGAETPFTTPFQVAIIFNHIHLRSFTYGHFKACSCKHALSWCFEAAIAVETAVLRVVSAYLEGRLPKKKPVSDTRMPWIAADCYQLEYLYVSMWGSLLLNVCNFPAHEVNIM